jgi:hypothetical protein
MRVGLLRTGALSLRFALSGRDLRLEWIGRSGRGVGRQRHGA